jgi:hypothetical protein
MMDINKLRELASKATPGEWVISRGFRSDTCVIAKDGDTYVTVALAGMSPKARGNAAYIAAAFPDMLLALLDVAEKAKVLIAYESEGAEAGWPNWDERFDALRTSLAALGEQGK